MKTWMKWALAIVAFVVLLAVVVGGTAYVAYHFGRIEAKNQIIYKAPIESADITLKTTPAPGPLSPVGVVRNDTVSIPRNGEVIVTKGGIVSGDIQVWDGLKWIALYDDNNDTSLLTTITKETLVRAPWGAFVSYISSLDEMKEADRAKGFKAIITKTW